MTQYDLTTKQKQTLRKKGHVNITRNGKQVRVTPSMVKGRQTHAKVAVEKIPGWHSITPGGSFAMIWHSDVPIKLYYPPHHFREGTEKSHEGDITTSCARVGIYYDYQDKGWRVQLPNHPLRKEPIHINDLRFKVVRCHDFDDAWDVAVNRFMKKHRVQ